MPNALVTPQWFDAVAGDSDAAAADFMGPVYQREFLVRLTPAAITQAGSVPGSQVLFANGNVSFTVVAGLGLPGQLLVRTLDSDFSKVTNALRTNSSVAYFELNAEVGGQLVPNDTSFGDQTGLLNSGANGTTSDADVDADEAWNITTGSSSVVISVIDSGVDYTHPDLYLNIWLNPGELSTSLRSSLVDSDADGRITFRDLNAPANSSFVTDLNGTSYIDAGDLLQDSRWENGVDEDANGRTDDLIGWDFRNNENDPFDTHGHGTHVAGTIGAVGNNAFGVAGLNWSTSIMPLRFLDAVEGQGLTGSTSDGIAAINYTTAMKTRAQDAVNVRVSNNSWGSLDSFSQTLRDSIAVNGQAGILFVAAAGNGEGRTGTGVDLDTAGVGFYPASYDLDHIVAVAASTSNDTLATFSQFGVTSIDLAAPGVGILSTEPGGGLAVRSGTSMATPHVSGAAALVFSRNPDATVQEVRQALLQSVDTKSALTGKVATGGRLNARAALQIDTFAPHVSLVAAPNVSISGAATYEFQVLYRDNQDIDFSSLDDGDVRVVPLSTPDAPLAVTISNLILDSDPGTAGNQPIVTYRLVPPGGAWSLDDNGEYRLELTANAVADTRATTPNRTPAQTLGSFEVSIAYEGQILVTTFVDGADSNTADAISQTAGGQSTLRSAIQTANAVAGLNTIVLEPGTYTLNVAGVNEHAAATGDLDLASEIVILGNGATIEVAGGIDRVFDVLASGNLTLRDVTIRGGNTSSLGGGLRNAGTTAIFNSTFTANTASEGGAIASGAGSISLTNVTVSTNSATNGAGIDVSGGSLSLLNTTITANTASTNTGGLRRTGSPSVGVTNTIVAGNSAPTNPDLSGTFSAASVSNNLIGNSTGSTGFTNGSSGNIVGSQANPVNPKLGPLQLNAGLTMTHELQAGSPAIDAGANGVAPTLDQRGVVRPVDGNNDRTAKADIGAVERYFGEITGVAFNDTNQDGVRDLGEVGIRGFEVFLDLNGNGVPDLSEPSTFTASDNPSTVDFDETGAYRFDQLVPGSYQVRMIPITGWQQLSPVADPNENRIDLTSFTAASGSDGSLGFTLDGGSGGRRLGQRAEGGGDFNGDGFDDFVVADAFTAYLVFGGSGVAVPERIVPHTGTFSLAPSIMRIRSAFSSVPPSIALAGDLDGDGFADLVISYGNSNGIGTTRVVYGRSTTPPAEIVLDSTPAELGGYDVTELSGPFVSIDQSQGRLFATDITYTDLNGDGTDDLVLAYHMADPGGRVDAGQTIVLFGQSTRYTGTIDLLTLPNANRVFINGISSGDASGYSVAGGSDVNGDGILDLAIAAPLAFRNGGERAEVYVVFGEATSPANIELSTLITDDRGAVIRLGRRGKEITQTVAMGDLNGDGFADIITEDNSAVRVVFGKPSFGAGAVIDVAASSVGTLTFQGIQNTFSVAVVGDANADGVDDLLIGDNLADLPNAQRVGAGYLIFGSTSNPLETNMSAVRAQTVDSTRAILLIGIAAQDQSGEHVATTGDFNNDRISDYLISAKEADPLGDGSGRLFAIFGRPNMPLRPKNGYFQADLTPGGSLTTADFGHRPIPATLRGTVYRDLNSNAMRDAGEAGISGFQVYLDTNNDGAFTSGEPTTTTNSSGDYVFTNIAPLTTYRVREVVPSGFTQTFPTSASGGLHVVNPTPGEEITLLDFGSIDLVGGVGLGTGGLSGRIFNDLNGNGQQELSEAGLANVTVFVDLNDNGVRDTSPVSEPQFVTTADNLGTPEDEAGAYSFTGLPARDYPVRMVTPNNMTQTSPRAGQFTPTSTSAGQGPVAGAAINFNGDAYPDLVIVTASRTDILVQLNLGDGTYGAPFSVAGPNALQRLVDPRSLAVADLNGDGRADLVIGNNSLNRPAVLLNNGSGLFVPVSVPALGLADTSSVAIGQFNTGDSFPDLVVASEFGNRVYVLINNGQGNFTLRDTLTPGNAPVSVLGIDLDKDGDSDVVVANRDDNTLRTFLLQANNTFLTSVPSLYTKATGVGPYRLAKGDLNGDTYEDIVVANVFDQRVSVFLSLQTGTLSDAVNLQVGGRPASVAIADLNNDGLPDLAVSTLSQQGFTTLLNLGGGRFQAPTAAGVASFADSLSPTILAFDVETDGDADLLILQPERDGGRLIVQRNTPAASNFRATVVADQTASGLSFGLISGTQSAGKLSIAATQSQKLEGNSGTTAFTFTVTRMGNTSGSSSADFAISGNTASPAAASDFGGTFPTGSVTFAANEMVQTITVLVTGDTLQEPTEGFLVTLSNPSSGSSLESATASSLITNDDAALSVTVNNAQRAEGQSGTTSFTFTVTRAGFLEGSTNVDFAVSPTGTSAVTAADFGGQFPSGMVSFAPNETTKIIALDVSGDSLLEADETFLLTLSNPTGGASISTATAIGTIQNDDASLSIVTTTTMLSEGHAGQAAFTFTVNRTGLLTSAVSATFTVSGGAGSPADAADFGGSFPTGTVSFAANDTSKVITINVSGDTQLEGDETFIVTLSNPSAGASLGTTVTAATILNDDATVTIAAANATRAEGQSGTTPFTFTVTRAGNATGAATVNYAVTGQGGNPAIAADFGGTLPTGTVTFDANETSKTMTINVSGDTDSESDEGFLVTLSNPSLGVVITSASASGTIQSDDSQLSIAPTNAVRIERNSGTSAFVFTVTRTGATSGTATANFAVTGQGAAPANAADFGGTLPTGTVSFGPGETSKTISINVTGDLSVETDEDFTVTLSNVSGAVLDTASAVGSILSDEFPATVRVNELGQLSISDTGGIANDITVTRNTNNEYVVTATNTELTTDGTTVTNNVVIPVAPVTGGLLADLGVGNDRLNLAGILISATVLGGDGNDTITGDSGADSLNGEAGDDSIDGGASDDQITGGLGNDILNGGTGTGDVLVEPANGTLTLSSTQMLSVVAAVTSTDTLSNIERANISGSTAANKIDLSGFAVSTGTTINGGGGNDTITGSPGPDMIFTLTGADSISGLGGADMISSGSGNDILSGGDGVDNLNGQSGNDLISGDAGNDVLVGGAGVDTLNGGADNDFLSGQAEAGLLNGGDGNDVLQGNSLNDTLNGDAGDDRLLGLQGNDVMSGGDGIDLFFGGAGNDTLSGGPSADDLRGEGGDDSMDGGADADRVIELLDTNVTITGSTAASSITTASLGVDKIANVERINLMGGAAANFFDARTANFPVQLAGDAGNDTLLGGSKGDLVTGGEGDDVLSGGAGNDVIDGGNGSDYVFEKADTNFTVNGVTITSTLTGTDTPTNIERITLIGGIGANKLDASLATVSVILIGGRGNDTLLGGNAADTLTGGNRNDATVAGGDGADSLDGGNGNDTLESDPSDTLIVGSGDTSIADVFTLLPSWIDAI